MSFQEDCLFAEVQDSVLLTCAAGFCGEARVGAFYGKVEKLEVETPGVFSFIYLSFEVLCNNADASFFACILHNCCIA